MNPEELNEDHFLVACYNDDYNRFMEEKHKIFEKNKKLIKEYNKKPWWVKWFTNEHEIVKMRIITNWSLFRRRNAPNYGGISRSTYTDMLVKNENQGGTLTKKRVAELYKKANSHE